MYRKAFLGNKWRPKEVVKLLHLDIILTKGDKLWRSDKTKEKSPAHLGVIKCGKTGIWGEIMEDKGYLVRFGSCRVISAPSSSPVINVGNPFLVQERGRLREGNVCLAFRQRGREEDFTSVCFFCHLQFKIIFMPKWYIWGWLILILFILNTTKRYMLK